MPDTIPQSFPSPDRDDLRDQWLRDVAFYSDGAQDTGEGSQPWIDGSVAADQLVPAYVRINTSASNLVLTDATGTAVETWAAVSGQTGRGAATGGQGFVQITASTGGTTILAGDEAKTSNGLRFACSVTATYGNDDLVPLAGVDTGPATNLAPGTVLTWTAPRPGCGTTATVWEDANGDGFIGGRLEETDAEVIARIIEAKRVPPASGNDAHYQKLINDAGVALGIPVQQGFTYPAIFGPGSVAYVFTLQPAEAGGARIPNAAQVSAVEGWLANQVPADDSSFACLLQSSEVDVVMEVAWQTGADPWIDVVPWPPYYAGSGAVTVHTVTSATVFALRRVAGGYSGIPDPVAGQTIALFNESTRTFVRKRIASVSGSGPWTLTCETTNDVSDVTYLPVAGQRAMPWSASLDSLVAPVLAYFDTLGPGEQVASFFDAGNRQRRSPAPPKSWPASVGARLINGVQDLALVADADLLEPTTPLVCPTGTAGSVSYLHQLGALAVFPLT